MGDPHSWMVYKGKSYIILTWMMTGGTPISGNLQIWGFPLSCLMSRLFIIWSFGLPMVVPMRPLGRQSTSTCWST